MSPTTIQAAHGKKLVAVTVPIEAKDFSILPEKFTDNQVRLRYRLCSLWNGNPEGWVEVKYEPIGSDENRYTFIGTLHYEGKTPVFGFDPERFVQATFRKYFDYTDKPDSYHVSRLVDTPEESFLSLLHSNGIGYAENPIGEKPVESDFIDYSLDTENDDRNLMLFQDQCEIYNQQLSAWQKAESGVLKPTEQIVFIEIE